MQSLNNATVVDGDKVNGGCIFLIGFMGSGKTHWGKIWAAKTGLLFFDLDEIIEQEEGKTIAAIFEQNGEAYFRQQESAVLKNLSTNNNCIIACGGGAACFNNNMQWMNENGTTIYLAATADEIYKRVITEQEKRPLIKNLSAADLLSFISQKLQERDFFYTQAKIMLPVTTLNDNTIKSILKNA